VSGRILLLRSGSAGPEEAPLLPEVTVLRTHTVEPRPEGIAEALAFDPAGAALVVSSKETVKVLLPLFPLRFSLVVAVGEGTGDFLRRVNTGGRPGGTLGGASTYSGVSSPQLVVPEVPGAAGVLHLLRRSSSSSASFPSRILWPHGSDAASEPLEEIRSLGFSLSSPVVYSKRALSSVELESSVLADFAAGRFGSVAVGSTAGLAVLLSAVPAPPHVRWGVLGPETAKAVVARNLPAPVVAPRARLSDLLDLLRKETP
jgi:uroporphyrinogen-III synthase